jgi:hypothetical protein
MQSASITYLHVLSMLMGKRPRRIPSCSQDALGLYESCIQLVADHYASGRQQTFKKPLLVVGGRLRLHVKNRIRG